MGVFKKAIDGAAYQFGLALAPALKKAEGELFLFLESAGGMDTFVAAGVDRMIEMFASAVGVIQTLRRAYLQAQSAALALMDVVGVDGAFDAMVEIHMELDQMLSGAEARNSLLEWYKSAREQMQGFNNEIESTANLAGGVASANTDKYAETMKRLAFETALARGQFDSLAKGAAEAMFNMDMLDGSTEGLQYSLEGLTEKQRALNRAYADLNRARHLEKMREEGAETAREFEGFGNSMANSLELFGNSLGDGEDAIDSFKRTMIDALNKIAESLLTAGLEAIFGGGGGGGGLDFGSLFSSILGGGGSGSSTGDAPIGTDTVLRSSASAPEVTYYMIDARGSETEEVLTKKVEEVLQRERPSIVQDATLASRDDRIRETGRA
jgi:hypothetical protein